MHLETKTGNFFSFVACVLKRHLFSLFVAMCAWLATIPCIWIVFGKLNTHLAATKILQLFVLCGCSMGADWVISNINDAKLRRWACIFLVNLLLGTVMLFCIYPGGWRWDDIIQLNATVETGTWPIWQGYLTTLFYMLCLITVPVPAFIVFVQVVVISLLATAIVVKIARMLECKEWYVAVPALLLGLLPPTLNMNLYPLRSAMHSYLEVLLLVTLGECCLDKSRWTLRRLIGLSVLTSIVAVWKSECIIFVAIVPVLVLVFEQRGKRIRSAATVLLLVVAIVLGLSLYPRFGTSLEGNSEDYTMTVYVPSLPYFVHTAKERGDAAYLDKLSDIYNNEVLERAYAEGKSGEDIYWHENEWPYIAVPKDSRDKAFYARCRDLFIEGAIRYPGAMLQSRWNQLMASMDFQWTPDRTNMLPKRKGVVYDKFNKNYVMNKQIKPKLRDFVTSYMEASKRFEGLTWVYNLGIPLAIVLVLMAFLSIKRSLLALLPLTLLVHNAAVFLSAPAYYFMYYYSLYVGAMFGLAAALAYAFNLLKAKRGSLVEEN